ncbi:MAG: L-serine ammonia-lyase, iron-sulfur-dependent, subunit beta [Firmicutes bacterium]|nr:L-serine ammonia-lyase, iron-sulfur-dependent, subunit beta [Bacillota bacterium]
MVGEVVSLANIFEIIGPTMVGPSSSHTAGAARLGKIARVILADIPAVAHIRLHGSFARTYRGHGTDKALIGGLLGYDSDDLRIRDSLRAAQDAGLEYHFEPTDLGDFHPNTALIELTGRGGKSVRVLGSSVGGGKVRILRVNDLDVDFTGEYTTLLVPHRDAPGVVAAVTSLLSQHRINIAQMKVYRAGRGKQAMIVLETDEGIDNTLQEQIDRLEHVTRSVVVNPV